MLFGEFNITISPRIRDFGDFILLWRELFTYYQLIQNDRFYGAVQATGKSSVASKCKSKFTFRAPNGTEEISKTLFIRRYREDLRQVSENSAQRVGKQWSLFLQLLQILWPFIHSLMGGIMYCTSTGHFSSINFL